MSKFISYLVNEYLLERGDQLKGYTIAVELFEQGEHFDPDQNALVRIHAGRLRRSLKTYYLEEGVEDPVLIEVPKGRYCPVITNNERKSSVSKSESSFREAKDSNDNTIAVLPFKNHSKDSELDYLAIGFSHELSDALTKYQDLKVIGIDRDIDSSISNAEVLKQFRDKGVSFLINGEIMAFGKHVKISFRLIHIPDNSQVWAGGYKFNSEKDNLFDVQERITSKITSHLSGEYGQISKFRYQKFLASRPTSLKEQELLLKFYHAHTLLNAESLYEFQEIAHETLEREPTSVLANAMVAGVHGTIYSQDLPGAEESYVKLGELAEKAYALNSNHKFALMTLAGKCFHYNERERLFRLYEEANKWIPLTPLGLGVIGLYFYLFGEWEFGKELIDKMFKNNIYVPRWYHGTTSLYYYRQFDYETSLREANKFQFPGYFMASAHRIAPLAQLGHIEEAKKEFETLLELRPDFIDRGRYLLKIHLKEDTFLEHFLEGFEKIGVKI
jgi:TolB-like protein